MGRPPRYVFYTPKQLNRQANRQVRQSIRAAQAPIVSAQKLADARAAAARESLKGFTLAGAEIMKDAAPLAGQAYAQAGRAESSMAGAFAGSTADAIRADVARRQGLIDQFAHGGQLAPVDATGRQNTLAAGGFDAGVSNEQLAGQQIAYAGEQPAYEIGRGQQAIVGNIHEQEQADQQYVQQMLDLAAKASELRTQILHDLQANELAKRNSWMQWQAQQALTGSRLVSQRQAQQRINIERQRYRQAVNEAKRQGRRVDATNSYALGYLVDREGRPILDRNGNRIKPQPRSSSGSPGVGGSGYKQAVRAVHSLSTPKPAQGLYAGQYKYMAQPGKGTFIQGYGWYTNDKNQAATTSKYNYGQAVTYLMNAYSINRKAAVKALTLGGWKRPSKKG